MCPSREHQYVRVTGILKIFGNKRYINANGIQPISDPHELYFHLMEAMYVTLVHQHGPVHFLSYAPLLVLLIDAHTAS